MVDTHKDKSNGIVALFSHKMAFLKSKFKDDPVRVQRHTVHHFKDLEQIFKMTYSMSLYSDKIIFKFRFQKSHFMTKKAKGAKTFSWDCKNSKILSVLGAPL